MRGAIAWLGSAALLLATCAATPAAVASPSATASAGASPSPYSAPSDAPLPSPLSSAAVSGTPDETPGPTPPPGTTPFPTPGPTITPGSTRVIGTLRHSSGSPAAGICVVLEKGSCPIATDDQGVWFTDIPAGPITWNFLYRTGGADVGRQFVVGTAGGELRLAPYTLTD